MVGVQQIFSLKFTKIKIWYKYMYRVYMPAVV
jgi:hypothetical protein